MLSTIPHSNVLAPSSQIREDRREEGEEKEAGVVLRVPEKCGLEGLAADIDEALLGEHVCHPSKDQATGSCLDAKPQAPKRHAETSITTPPVR